MICYLYIYVIHLQKYSIFINLNVNLGFNFLFCYSLGNESQIPIPDCNEGSRKVYRFQVRAINTNNNITYHGPWSEEGEGSCFLQGKKCLARN